MTPPEAGPSSPSSTTQAVPGFTEQEAYLYRVFETFDAGTFDWNAYQGTYKGEQVFVGLGFLNLVRDEVVHGYIASRSTQCFTLSSPP